MIGSLISAGLQVAQGIAGAVSSAKAANRAKRETLKQKAANDAWYNRRYNEDATQRADAQRILTQTRDAIKNRNASVAGQQAVGGQTEEAVAAEKARNSEAMGNAVSAIAAQGQAQKDSIEQQYRTRNAEISSQLANIENNKASEIGKATMGSIQGIGSVGASLDNYFDAKKDAKVASAAETSMNAAKSAGRGLFDWIRSHKGQEEQA